MLARQLASNLHSQVEQHSRLLIAILIVTFREPYLIVYCTILPLISLHLAAPEQIHFFFPVYRNTLELAGPVT